MKKLSFIVIVLAIIGLLSIPIYFVSQFSSTYPPIEEYDISKDLDKLIDDINIISNSTNISFNITDTTGTIERGFSYYANIEIQVDLNEYNYYIKFDKDNNKKSIISLIGAFDLKNKTGGYKKKDRMVYELTKIFEYKFINKVK